MTAVSLAGVRGVDMFSIKDFTIGASAPTATHDFEVRYNTTDQNSVAVTRKDIIIFLKGVIRSLEMGGTTVQVSNLPPL